MLIVRSKADVPIIIIIIVIHTIKKKSEKDLF